MQIGFIGLGNIGAAIAANLLADGDVLVVHDRDPARERTLGELGATVVRDPAEVARESEIGFVSLPTPDSVNAVAERWIEGAPPGAILVDLSTNAPDAIRELGARVDAAGCRLLEAPLTGGAPGARARQLVFLVGGEPEVFARCEPILQRLSRAVFHVGGLGLGNTAKLVNSLLAFTATWSSLEGLTIAAASGIDLRTMVEIVRTGGAGNFFMDRMVEGLNRRGRPPGFAMALAAKDAQLALEVARGHGVPTPVASQVAQVLATAVDEGLGERDWSDLVELIERQSQRKLELPPPRSGF